MATNKLTVKRLVKILQRVPEKRFAIADLAPELLNAKGEVDISKAIERQGDLNLAIIEVQMYVEATRDALSSLVGIGSTITSDPYEDTEAEEALLDEEFAGDDE